MADEEEGKYAHTEQEEKEWEKKKRTRERVSYLMGQYLLKGYRMLNVNCSECGVRRFYVRMRIRIESEYTRYIPILATVNRSKELHMKVIPKTYM